MKIGVLGTGDVGRVLAAGLAGVGHEVMIGTRDPSQQKMTDWLSDAGKGVNAGSFAEAAAFGELLILAIGWSNVKNAIDLTGVENFAGKVLLDATNPLRFDAEGKPPVLDIGHTDSAGETVQRWLPDARVVKAFNIVGNPHMISPDFPDGKPDMFICGNDAAAKQTAGSLIKELGWPPVIDLGGIENARYLEPLAMVWIVHFFNTGFNGNHAFKLLRK
ncbi:MAG: NAD(P)-binding domain-containing protein [Gammaproteobacteria bacterium]